MSRYRFAALAAALALVSTAASATDTVPAPLNFTVLRNGEAVGTHSVRFQPAGDGVKVAVDTNVVVKIALVPVYRFEHHGRETWQNGRLAALESNTNDDGAPHVLKVAVGAAGLDVSGDGNASHLPAATLPASLWNRATAGQSVLMNTLDGHAMAVRITDLGEDTVSVHGQPHPAHHYAMAGDLARELWYDGAGTLVQVRFKAKDDSDIQYVLN